MTSNKQYGLIKPKQPSGTLKRPSIFDEDSDSNEAAEMCQTDWIKKSYQKEAERNYQKRAVKTQLDKAMEEDPSVFQYDELYDEMQTKKAETVKKKKDVDRKPRYIQSLLVQAERRKRENEYRNERLIQKEREAEGEMYKDKETFVTSAYKKKLEEFKKMDEAAKRQDMLEDIGDVTKQQDLSGFYRHLYESTVSDDKKKSRKIKEEADDDLKLSKSPNPVDTKETGEESFPLSKTTSKTKNFRKRRSSSSSEAEAEETKQNSRTKTISASSVEKSTNQNQDADTDISSSSSSGSSSSSSSSSGSESESETEKGTLNKSNSADLTSGSEEGEIVELSKKKLKMSKNIDSTSSKKEVKSSPGSEKIEGQKENSANSSKQENGTKAETEKATEIEPVEEEEEVEEKIDIWEKRTVGAVFDEALKRYLERKAERLANRSG